MFKFPKHLKDFASGAPTLRPLVNLTAKVKLWKGKVSIILSSTDPMELTTNPKPILRDPATEKKKNEDNIDTLGEIRAI